MIKTKYMMIILLVSFMLFIIPTIVNAADTQTTTSVINDVTVQWSYTLNDSNQIENLKCTNPTELKGNITVPSQLDEKTVIKIGDEAFKSATNITGVTISSSITSIGYGAFNGCSSLTNVDLGSIQSISFDVFKDCPKLTSIKIPKTLVDGTIINVGVFTGTTVLTSATFEDGLTEIPAGILQGCSGITSVTIPSSVTKINCYAFAGTSISEIDIPNSVTDIEYDAFANCADLSNVDLGSIQSISFDVFKDCPKLTSIKIPKTLVDGTIINVGVFTGTTVLTSATFEDGLTEIPAGILQGCSGITSVTIPSSVTKINCYAFAGTSISEIDIPNSVTDIEYYAFKDCPNLTKVTILDNCTSVGWFTIYPTTDTVFNNHNDDLTIYCYEGSKIAEYAIGTNIKYVYLTRPSTENTKEDDTTTITGTLPQTGVGVGIILALIVLIGTFIFAFIKYNKYNSI